MPSPVTVWMVRLRRDGDLRETRGQIRIDDDALVFTTAAGSETRLPFSETRKVRRIVGSPVLVIRSREGDDTAFYFAEPPPLRLSGRPSASEPPPTSILRAPSRGRRRREGIRYLTARSRGTTATIREWVVAIRERIGP